MQIILLERVVRLGQLGDVVNVKPGFARNFLLPQGKALRATKENISYFEAQKKVLEADNLKQKGEAEKLAKKMGGLTVSIIRSASEVGHLYGSVTARDIADVITAEGFKIGKAQVRLDRAYKLLGLYPVKIALHPEVALDVTINIARTEEEAKLQLKKGAAMVAQEEKEAKEAKAPTAKAKKDDAEVDADAPKTDEEAAA